MNFKKSINWKRALVAAVGLWVLIFFEVSVLMFGFKLSAPDPNYYFIHALLLTSFVIVIALAYFYPKKVKKGVIEGILLGIIFFVIGIILDSVITIPLFVHDYKFLLNPELLIGYIGGIVLCAIVGAMKKANR